MAVKRKSDLGEEHLRRVRRICSAMPECTEKLSHGEPTFFVRKKVFAMLANNHHDDGHIAVWIPAPPGFPGDADPKFAEDVLPSSLCGGAWLGRY